MYSMYLEHFEFPDGLVKIKITSKKIQFLFSELEPNWGEVVVYPL